MRRAAGGLRCTFFAFRSEFKRNLIVTENFYVKSCVRFTFFSFRSEKCSCMTFTFTRVLTLSRRRFEYDKTSVIRGMTCPGFKLISLLCQ